MQSANQSRLESSGRYLHFHSRRSNKQTKTKIWDSLCDESDGAVSVGEAVGYTRRCLHGEVTITVCGSRSRFTTDVVRLSVGDSIANRCHLSSFPPTPPSDVSSDEIVDVLSDCACAADGCFFPGNRFFPHSGFTEGGVFPRQCRECDIIFRASSLTTCPMLSTKEVAQEKVFDGRFQQACDM